MSYYILPKNVNNINVHPKSAAEPCNQTMSFSFLNYYMEIKKQLLHTFENEPNPEHSLNNAIKILNPYEFIFSSVPGSKCSVSKLTPCSNLFYDLLEIYHNLNCFDAFHYKTIKSLHISKNHIDSIECFQMFREGCDDEILWYDHVDIDNFTDMDKKFDFMFIEGEGNTDHYFQFLVKVLSCILKNQNYNGTMVVKIGDIFHKPVVDFIYYLTSLYEKVYIAKPCTNNIMSSDKYIVCNQFKYDASSNFYLKINYLKLIIFLKKIETNHVTDILDMDTSYYFKNKVEDLNIIIGQNQLETMDMIISLFKHKNKQDKFENITKLNIQKSVAWCEKYKIPCNKFTDKTNIFLPMNSIHHE